MIGGGMRQVSMVDGKKTVLKVNKNWSKTTEKKKKVTPKRQKAFVAKTKKVLKRAAKKDKKK